MEKGVWVMTEIERRMFLFLIVVDAGAILTSMIAGPFGLDTMAIAAAVSAVIISIGLILYGLYFWNRRER